ncbi:Rrf2 family transcriptional regulator [Ktedonosporobacter rubrisoli]|uniref:Rrf2 family transcriptional regulator n=1 Tax=Ktedonosporobacter rubrisoli TaxID=2509675 RepID=A0A4V0YZH9_KTERU|nr:Rrf2 family transcriptional regulator [Ktedonosporobacter rubrisoli]QBD79781.1 Rrf2 family transcriptional regulator [Ktedonosporobacter rubrisoli]
MSANSRLTLATHALVWMAYYKDAPEMATSERIARSVNANPVVLRGLLGMMEKQHLVSVQRGGNAGWKLARRPEEIALLDIYRAVKPHSLFSLHHTPPNPHCVIGCNIGSALQDVYGNVQNTLEQELARTTIADVLQATLAPKAETQQADVAHPAQASPQA